MVRDAIAQVLREHCQPHAHVVPVDHVSTVTVDGDRAAVGVVLLAGWRARSLDLVTTVARHLESVSEIERFELTVVWTRDRRNDQPARTRAEQQWPRTSS
jgi:hypothetical protein